jgi:thiol-disulfide isomerase/thioredoxin
MRITLLISLLLVVLTSSCVVIDNQFEAIPPGKWRGILKLEDNKTTRQTITSDFVFEEVTEGQLPFNFEVIYENKNTFYIEMKNGEERIIVRDIQFGRNPATNQDTIRINFPFYDSYLTGLYEEDVIEGLWVVNDQENYSIPFVAFHGKDYRFTELRKPPFMDVTGSWETRFEVNDAKPYPAVGEFQQQGNYLTGTFRTETGDYRFLEGTVQADKIYLSCFEGAHAFLFEAKILPDSTIVGTFRSGKNYKTIWEAKRNPNFELSNPDSLTYAKSGLEKVAELNIKNKQGKTISLNDYGNKIKLIQILGTWCPNCRDETEFLVRYLDENKEIAKQIAIIGLAFERYKAPEKAQKLLDNYVKQMNVPYEMVLAGYYSKAEASKVLPFLSEVIAYPTLIFVDRNNQIQRIHTGFSGSATSKYEEFRQSFEQTITRLLNKPT